MIEPISNYVLVEVIIEDRGVVTIADKEDSWQKGRVQSVSKYALDSSKEPATKTIKKGDVVYWEKFAEDNSAPDFKKRNLELIDFSRIMAMGEFDD